MSYESFIGILLLWIALSLPGAILLGKILRNCDKEMPDPLEDHYADLEKSVRDESLYSQNKRSEPSANRDQQVTI